jgi:hypothetical protein
MKDTKIKWNSLFDMLDRFLALKNFARKVLIDTNSDLQFTDDEMTLLQQVRNKLHPIKVTVTRKALLSQY